jgi:hypothetical protein
VGEANVTFDTVDVPGAMDTVILGINNLGEMVGYYSEVGATAGWLFSNGNFSFVNYPASDATEAVGINDSGLISGLAYLNRSIAVGFTYNETTFTKIALSNRQLTFGEGINNAGEVVGGDGDTSTNQAFEWLGGKFKNITPPPGGWLTAEANFKPSRFPDQGLRKLLAGGLTITD